MVKNIESNNNPSNPINLDSDQRKELENLINDLKNDMIMPKRGGQSGKATSEVGQRRPSSSAVGRTGDRQERMGLSDWSRMWCADRIPA